MKIVLFISYYFSRKTDLCFVFFGFNDLEKFCSESQLLKNLSEYIRSQLEYHWYGIKSKMGIS